jgi:energy-coupling factor transporter ATP-binding protein EcfA2
LILPVFIRSGALAAHDVSNSGQDHTGQGGAHEIRPPLGFSVSSPGPRSVHRRRFSEEHWQATLTNKYECYTVARTKMGDRDCKEVIMSSGSSPSGGRIQALLTLVLTLLGPPAALLSFAHSLNLPLWVTIVLTLAYELLALFVSFLTQVWEKLKTPWIEAIANKVDQGTRSVLSHYHHHYCRYFTYEYRDLDVKGITTQGISTLDLEDVFVELCVVPEAPQDASFDPLRGSIDLLQIPAKLRSGSHTIWKYLAAPHLRNQHFVVLGPPGSGKTTLLKYLGLVLVHRKQSHVAKHFWRKLPVLLFLREQSKVIMDKAEYTLVDAIRESTNRWNYPMPVGWIEHRLERGQCLILFDGLDEVADATQRQRTVAWVERQMRNHGNNRFVLTSRPFGYRENPLANVTTLEVQPFTFQQATQFVMSWYRATEIKSAVRDDPGVRMRAERGARDLLRRLRETPALFHLIVNPLLLTMIATVHRYRGTLPGARIELYKEICEVFLGKHQAARGIVQELRAEQRQLVLQSLAYEMMLQGIIPIDGHQAERLIADPLQQVDKTLVPHDFLENVQNSSGLFLEREHNVYSFAHKTFQEYLAAVHISKHGLLPILTARVPNEWWHETIRLYCALGDATPIIEACLNISSTEALILALECEREALIVQAVAQRQVEDIITQGIESTDPERQRITTEALLARRLRKMYVLNEQAFIDTALVTHAEYQLFLNEQRRQGKYYQPDHWIDFTFPAGQGRQPALGMRRSDAKAFCAWLSEQEGAIWRYRLPDEKDLAQVDQGIWRDFSQDTGYWIEGERRFVWSQGQPSLSLSRNIQAIFTNALDPDITRALEIDPALVRALDLDITHGLDLDHDIARVHDLVRDLTHISQRARYLTSTSQRDIALVSVRARSVRALDLDRNVSDRNLALAATLDLIRSHALAFTFDRTQDLALPRASVLALVHTCAKACAHTSSNLASTFTLARASASAFTNALISALALYIDLVLLEERRAGKLPAKEGILLVKERTLKV